MFKPLHFSFRPNPVFLVFSTLLIGVALFYWGCQKEKNLQNTSVDRNLTIEEVRSHYAGYDEIYRSEIKIPLQLEPIWEKATIFKELKFPIILAPVDTGVNGNLGGNLAFFKDSIGDIKSCFLTWKKDPNSPYSSTIAPISSINNNFSGWMMMVSEDDTIKVISQIGNGLVYSYKKGALYFFDLESNVSVGLPTNLASNREWPPCWWPFNHPTCPNPNGSGTAWWENLWSSITSVFGQVWDSMSSGGGTENVLISGIYFPWDYSTGLYNEQSAGGSVDVQFQSQLSTCNAIKEYMESVGEIPSNFSEVDIHFCQLINDLSLDVNTARCLFSQYGSAFVEEIWEYWNESNQNPGTAELLNAYIQSQCQGTGTSALAEFIKEQFCLEASTLEIWMQLSQQCGMTEQSAQDGLENMSDCVRNLILQDQSNYINEQFGVQLTPQQVGDFIGPEIGCISTNQMVIKLNEITNHLSLNTSEIQWLIENSRTQLSYKVIESLYNFLSNHSTEDGAIDYAEDHLAKMMQDADYNKFVTSVMGWPTIIWTIGKELIADKAIDILFNLIPGFNKQDEIRDAIKAISHGDWLEFTWEAAKVVIGQAPWSKAFDIAKDLRALWIVLDTIDDLVDQIGTQRLERAWNILFNSASRFSTKALKYVDDLATPRLGGYFATIYNYNPNFKAHFSDVANNIGAVHHAVPQDVLTRYPYFGITNDQMHSLENLRGIPNNGSLDHQTITNYWQAFFNSNPNASYYEVMNYVKFIDDEFGHLFVPPVR